MDATKKRICVISHRSDFFKIFFENKNYSVIELSCPVLFSELSLIKNGDKFDYCIVEPQRYSQDSIMELIESLKGMGRLIFILDEIRDEIRSTFIKQGVVDVLHSSDASYVFSYIELLEKESVHETGKIIIMEDNEIRKKILHDIISRFGYRSIFVESTNELYNNINNSTLQFILINLGIKYNELNNFVRTYFSRVEFRRVPVITYKDMSEGLFIHEIVKGLNRLTRFILSPEELYSFLIDIFFKKDMLPIIDSLNVSVDYKNHAYYACESLSRIYYLKEGDIIDPDNILRNDNIEKLFGMVDLLQHSLVKVSGFRWLKKDNCANHLFTCGAGV